MVARLTPAGAASGGISVLEPPEQAAKLSRHAPAIALLKTKRRTIAKSSTE
jgi:hypothetical protein